MNRHDGANADLPPTLTVGGVQRELTIHLQQQSEMVHNEITLERLTDVLNNWVVRGIRQDRDGRRSIAFLGWIEHRGGRRLMRVAISIDNRRIISAFLDRKATEKLNSGDMDYFQRNYERVEVRDEPEIAL